MSIALGGKASAQETTTYVYDALGRLVSTSVSGGPNSGNSTGTCFDAAGNRTTYATAIGGTATCYVGSPISVPPPTPPVPPINLGSNPNPNSRTFVVVPLSDFTIIPIS